MDIFGTIQMAISVVILAVLYYKLYKQEVPKPAWLPIAIVPVIGGLIVYNVCIPAYLVGMNGILRQLAQSPLAEGVFGSFFSAFILAAFPEEAFKCLMMLLLIFIFHKRVRNVYEYILIGAAVGLGFTIAEEMGYVTDGVNPLRIPLVAGHMTFNMIMGAFLGSARYKRENGQPGVVLNIIAGLTIGTILHTVFDAFTVANPALKHINSMGVIDNVFIAVGVAVVIGAIVLQFVVFKKAARDCKMCCDMTFADGPEEPVKQGKHSRR